MNEKINNKNYFTKNVYLIAFFLLVLLISFGDSYAASDTMVVYYSRTGKSEAVAKALARASGAEIIQIKDAKERSGSWGYIGAAYDSQMVVCGAN